MALVSRNYKRVFFLFKVKKLRNSSFSSWVKKSLFCKHLVYSRWDTPAVWRFRSDLHLCNLSLWNWGPQLQLNSQKCHESLQKMTWVIALLFYLYLCSTAISRKKQFIRLCKSIGIILILWIALSHIWLGGLPMGFQIFAFPLCYAI